MGLRVIHQFGPSGKPAIPALKAFLTLKDEPIDCRGPAAVILSRLDPTAREAVPVLREALRARKRLLRDSARYHLEKIFDESP
jgi:hypothetical protein